MPPGLTEIAQEVWATYEPILYNLGVLTELDGLAFEQMCTVYADWVKYKDEILKVGELVEVRNAAGDVMDIKIHPYAKLKVKAQEQLNRLLANFGMTPADRSRIVIAGSNKNKSKVEKVT